MYVCMLLVVPSHVCSVVYMVSCGVVWCGVVWCGVMWCGTVCLVRWMCGVVWYIWCHVAWCGVVRAVCRAVVSWSSSTKRSGWIVRSSAFGLTPITSPSLRSLFASPKMKSTRSHPRPPRTSCLFRFPTRSTILFTYRVVSHLDVMGLSTLLTSLRIR